MAKTEHPRILIPNFLSLDLCKELEFIHKSCGTVGYRPNVFSTTLSHLIATNCAHFIMPFVPLRERLKDKVEEFFGCEFELFVEFTGLISWTKGSSIGWHSDDNRPYLKQRDFAVVCYLNTYDQDFKGGLFHFQDSDPSTVVPVAGDIVMYTADIRNIHSVDEIIDGERLTLTMWFTRDRSHDEDTKLLNFLSQTQIQPLVTEPFPILPLPAPSKMYWFSPDQNSTCGTGFDIRFARIKALGFGLYSPQAESCSPALDSSKDFSEILMEPLRLTKDDELFDGEFSNILHALQVVQFYHWNPKMETCIHIKKSNLVSLSKSQRDNIDTFRNAFLKEKLLAETIFSRAEHLNCNRYMFDWARFCAAVSAWEVYCSNLVKEMLTSLPHWRTDQSIFSVSRMDIDNSCEFGNQSFIS